MFLKVSISVVFLHSIVIILGNSGQPFEEELPTRVTYCYLYVGCLFYYFYYFQLVLVWILALLASDPDLTFKYRLFLYTCHMEFVNFLTKETYCFYASMLVQSLFFVLNFSL